MTIIMLRPRVLSVGQCAYDHSTISRHLLEAFAAEVSPADTPQDALQALRCESFDLVLVNRVVDRDGSSGLELIETLISDPALAGLAIMLVSNLPGAQLDAVARGALPGFGKAELFESKTHRRLSQVLDSPVVHGESW